MSEIHSCGYFCQIPACVLKQRDTLRDKLQTSESNGPVAAAPQAVEAMSDAYIESLVRKHGGKWGGSYWVFEDADLHPFVRTILTLASHTQAVPQTLDVMSDEPYNGEGWELLAMALAAEEHDDIHRLIWCGGPILEPWGEVWEQYEDEAKRMIELVKKHAGPALSSHTAPADHFADVSKMVVKSVLICPRCKVDRFNADCPSRIGCPMDAQAHLTLKATPKDKP